MIFFLGGGVLNLKSYKIFSRKLKGGEFFSHVRKVSYCTTGFNSAQITCATFLPYCDNINACMIHMCKFTQKGIITPQEIVYQAREIRRSGGTITLNA